MLFFQELRRNGYLFENNRKISTLSIMHNAVSIKSEGRKSRKLKLKRRTGPVCKSRWWLQPTCRGLST